ncbi:hypothetical protein [Teichococcus oryzae]|uniref:Uncharacterized protein n=1 Tax=Teichococcus oryzae TaxID=1608942 RepID=A0A5B2TL92_9PROT|nr:hypothetical protein [Pseudoroseomonas oryzae]KAA2214933.1 hypothetical protein F0Q34_04435 [Pseudoroseomonas oryzae]
MPCLTRHRAEIFKPARSPEATPHDALPDPLRRPPEQGLMRRRMALLPVLLLLGAATPPEAELRVDPPSPYRTTRMEPTPPQTARIAVARPGAPMPDCQVAFVPAPPADQKVGQPALNALARSPAWQKLERARIATAYDVQQESIVEQDGVAGLRLAGTLRPRPSLEGGSRAAFTILETPRGRTTTVCAAPAEEFARRQAEFDAVARGVTPPR